MKSSSSGQLLRHSGVFIAGAVLSLTTLGMLLLPTPVVAHPQLRSQPVIERIIALKESGRRWIEINLSTQSLIAWEGQEQVREIIVSTGKASTPTHPGVFAVRSKHPTHRMRGADYDIPNVPYTMYFYRGYAIHGANWHNNFGTPVSHGCINLPLPQAEWLFEWASVGTPVIIHQ